jgi:hypothetical protein
MTSSAADSGVPKFPPFAFAEAPTAWSNTGTLIGAVGEDGLPVHAAMQALRITMTADFDTLHLQVVRRTAQAPRRIGRDATRAATAAAEATGVPVGIG